MADKLVFNCTTGEMEEVAFTPEEIAQRAYEASLPPVISPKTEVEILQEAQDATSSAVDFLIMNSI
jgi:hypothetical protein